MLKLLFVMIFQISCNPEEKKRKRNSDRLVYFRELSIRIEYLNLRLFIQFFE